MIYSHLPLNTQLFQDNIWRQNEKLIAQLRTIYDNSTTSNYPAPMKGTVVDPIEVPYLDYSQLLFPIIPSDVSFYLIIIGIG